MSEGQFESQEKPQPRTEERFDYVKNKYKDFPWAIIFLIHLFAMIAAAVITGKTVLSSLDFGSNDSASVTTNIYFFGTVLAAFGGTVFGIFWLKVMMFVKMRNLILLNAFLMFIFALFLCYLNLYLGFFTLFLWILSMWWLYFAWSRITFAETILRTSTQSLNDKSGPLYVAYLIAFFQIVWIVVWVLASQGLGLGGTFEFFLLISLFWTLEILKNISHVTTAGVVAMWWFLPEAPSATCSAFKRSLTTSFGSICLGSLIVAVIKAIRIIVYSAMRQARDSGSFLALCLLACLRCLLDCIEHIFKLFNKYAYTYVAVYGDNFISAGRKTWTMFINAGFDAIINDDLSGMVLNLGIGLGGMVGGVLFAGYAASSGMAGVVGFGFLGFIVSAWTTSLMMNVVSSAIATTFVCWAEDSSALERAQPEAFQKIREACEARKTAISAESPQ